MRTISRSQIQTDFNPNVPVGHTAFFHCACCLPEGVQGCPLGRGETEESAMADLLKRTNRESGLDLALIGAPGSLY